MIYLGHLYTKICFQFWFYSLSFIFYFLFFFAKVFNASKIFSSPCTYSIIFCWLLSYFSVCYPFSFNVICIMLLVVIWDCEVLYTNKTHVMWLNYLPTDILNSSCQKMYLPIKGGKFTQYMGFVSIKLI